jgi:hypothetical protein
MTALVPRGFGGQQERQAHDLESVPLLVELTATPSGDVAPSSSARPGTAAAPARLRDRITRTLERSWRLDPEMRSCWLAAMGEIDVFDAGAPEAFEGLRKRIEVYVHGFSYDFGRNSYCSPGLLQEDLWQLVSSLAELERACRNHVADADR